MNNNHPVQYFAAMRFQSGKTRRIFSRKFSKLFQKLLTIVKFPFFSRNNKEFSEYWKFLGKGSRKHFLDEEFACFYFSDCASIRSIMHTAGLRIQ
jgi:hypothetical protein